MYNSVVSNVRRNIIKQCIWSTFLVEEKWFMGLGNMAYQFTNLWIHRYLQTINFTQIYFFELTMLSIISKQARWRCSIMCLLHLKSIPMLWISSFYPPGLCLRLNRVQQVFPPPTQHILQPLSVSPESPRYHILSTCAIRRD